MTRIYIIFISLQVAFAQLLGANYIQYYSAFLLYLGSVAIMYIIFEVDFDNHENLCVLFLAVAVIFTILTSPSRDVLLALRNGIRFLSSFLPFILFTGLMKGRKTFLFYLRTNTYVLIISVILLNFLSILFFNQNVIEDPYRNIERYAGYFSGAGWHGLAHSSLLTIFLISYYKPLASSRTERFLLSIAFVLACYLIIKSGARTVYIGLFIFMFAWLLLKRKYLWLAALVQGIVLLFLFHKNFQALLIEFDPSQAEFDTMGSGRGQVWQIYIRYYMMQPWFTKLFGTGEHLLYVGGLNLDAHNDYLKLLLQYGIVGLLAFLSFYFGLFIKAIRIIKTDIGKLYVAMLLSIAVMNFVSNSYVSRVSIAIIFWPLLIPLFNRELLNSIIENPMNIENNRKQDGIISVRNEQTKISYNQVDEVG